MKPIRALLALGLGLVLVGLTLTLYLIKGADWEKSTNIISLVRELTYADSLLDLEILRLRSAIVNHYDDVTDAYDLTRRNLQVLQVQVKDLNMAAANLPEELATLEQIVTRKLNLVETIKLQNSILRNSEGYLPLLLDEYAKEEASHSTILGIHWLLLRTIVLSDQAAAEKLKIQFDALSPSKNYSDSLDSIKTRVAMHGLKTLQVRQTLNSMLVEYFKIPVSRDLKSLTQLFIGEQARRGLIREWFRAIFYATVFGFILLAAIVVISLLRLSKKIRDEERVFVLQALAHEVRTPATGIVLAAESMRDSFDSFSEEVQDSYLRLCNDAQRLQGVIATTTRYLRAEQDTERLHIQTLASINDFLVSILETYEGKLRLELAPQDASFTTDFQWLQVCVINLVDNAINHGKGLVTVTAAWTGDLLKIQVADQGDSMSLDLDKLAKPFAKSGKSKGLGLGLTIVKQVAILLRGNLTYQGPPTAFTLTLANWAAQAKGDQDARQQA